MTANAGASWLYATNGEPVDASPGPRPSPGTIKTHSFETVDNDRTALLLYAGVVR